MEDFQLNSLSFQGEKTLQLYCQQTQPGGRLALNKLPLSLSLTNTCSLSLSLPFPFPLSLFPSLSLSLFLSLCVCLSLSLCGSLSCLDCQTATMIRTPLKTTLSR